MTPNFISSGGKTGGAIYYPFIKDIGIHEMRRWDQIGATYLPATSSKPFQISSQSANYIVWEV